MIKRIHSTLFIVKDISKTTEFYKTLGFDVKEDKDAIRIIFGDYRLAFMAEKDTTIKTDTENLKGVGMFLYFEVENVDEFYKDILNKGLNPKSEPTTWPWGKREFVIKDPDGFKLVFFSNVQN